MRLKQQIILLIELALLVPAIAITSISIYKINTKAKGRHRAVPKGRNDKPETLLKHITDIAWQVTKNDLVNSQRIKYRKSSRIRAAFFVESHVS